MAAEPPCRANGSVIPDAWHALRRYTPARIALGRCGSALPTHALLSFELAHARARDAVAARLDVNALQAALEAQGWTCSAVTSRAEDGPAYLARPDWGRRLAPKAAEGLRALAGQARAEVLLVCGDGLSAAAVQRHAPPLLERLRAAMLSRWRLAPVVIATRARVALADEIGEILGARLVIHLIGERPGLSAPNSLGVYVTHAPRLGRSDAERNCISNVRPDGLGYEAAAAQVLALADAALRQGLTGPRLRFDAGPALPPTRTG